VKAMEVTAGLAKVMAAYRRVDGLKSLEGPTLGNEYGKTLTVPYPRSAYCRKMFWLKCRDTACLPRLLYF